MSEDDKTLPSPERPVRDEVLAEHSRQFAEAVSALLFPVHADVRLLIGHVTALGKRVEAVEARLLAIEHHVSLNGARGGDTEPAPETLPENARPET